jgi:2-keto-4-pentenoate hydratase/2-oxohepta-3-ene-1,7-dioic acid hydratase in catechol pathway
MVAQSPSHFSELVKESLCLRLRAENGPTEVDLARVGEVSPQVLGGARDRGVSTARSPPARAMKRHLPRRTTDSFTSFHLSLLTGKIMNRPSKIVCVGRNYAAHAAELGNVVPDERPLLFFKPPSALVGDGEPIELPKASKQVEHEGEIGIVLHTALRRADENSALAAVAGLTCVNDVTARDLQKTDDQWARAKGFDTFCPMSSNIVPLSELPPLDEVEVMCRVNGETRQHGSGREMIFKIPTLLSYISHIMTLEAGDLVATGTPAGVGPLAPGDRVEVEIPGVGVLSNPVVAEVS